MDDPTHLPGAPRKAMHSIASGHHRDGIQQRPTYTPPRERNEAMRAFGNVVYAARCTGGVIKIGVTHDLPTRLSGIGGELLGFMPGTYEDEQAVHARLTDHLHHGREWYFPTPDVLAIVNEMRGAMGLEPVAA